MAAWVLRSFLPSGMRTEKQLFLRPSHLPPRNYAEWTARSFYEEASRTLSHPRRSGRAIQGWDMHVGIARVGHAP